MGRVVAQLNAVNELARQRGNRWDLLTNNCSHTVHNALAAAGVWDPKEPRVPGVLSLVREVVSVGTALVRRRMTDFSFPANTLVRLHEAGNTRPIDDADRAFGDHDIRRTSRDGWITTGPGALVASQPMHDPSRNDLFAPGKDPFLFSVPLLWDKRSRFERLVRRPAAHLTDLHANLAHFRERYIACLATLDPHRGGDGDRQRFARSFYAYIERELRRTEELMKRCDELEAPRGRQSR